MPVTVILIRDKSKTGFDLALVTTQTGPGTAAVIERYAARWAIEVAIEDANVSIAHCAFFPSGVLEESSLAGFYLDTQAAAASAADMHGGEFATLDLMQNGLPGDAEGGGGLLQR